MVSVAANGDVTLTQAAGPVGGSTLKAVATNGGGSLAADITLTVRAAAPTGNLAPDVTVSTWPQAIQQLDLWAAGAWPQGKARGSDQAILGITGAQTGNVNLQNYNFAGTGGVMIRGVGAYNTTGCSARTQGEINLNGSRKVTLALMEVWGGSNRVRVNSTTDVTLDRLWLKGWSGTRTYNTNAISGNSHWGIDTTNAPLRLTIKGCAFEGFVVALRMLKGSTDMKLLKNAWGIMAHDHVKMSGTHLRPLIEDNYDMGVFSAASNGYHEDFFQFNNGTFNDMILRYNVAIMRPWYNGSDSPTDGNVAHQGFFFGSGRVVSNLLAEQNFMLGNNGLVKTPGGSSTTRFNTLITYDGVSTANLRIDGNVTDRNCMCVKTSGGFDVGKAGTNGLAIPVGATADADLITPYFSGKPSRTAPISTFRPKSGAQTHWNHSNPKGAHECLRRIFVDGTHPENDTPWPCGVLFRRHLNTNNGLANSSYTGLFDGNGRSA